MQLKGIVILVSIIIKSPPPTNLLYLLRNFLKGSWISDIMRQQERQPDQKQMIRRILKNIEQLQILQNIIL